MNQARQTYGEFVPNCKPYGMLADVYVYEMDCVPGVAFSRARRQFFSSGMEQCLLRTVQDFASHVESFLRNISVGQPNLIRRVGLIYISNAHIQGTPKTGGSNKSPSPATADVLSKFRDAQHDPNPVPQVSLPESPSLTDSIGIAPPSLDLSRPPPMWLNPAYAKHIVKGNFMTLSARPKTVEPGEWIAHQVVEHYRNLWNFVRIVHEKEEDGSTICNPSTCPKMSAGKDFSYTWLNKKHEPVELPAHEYMTLMQRWISGKIEDTTTFPTDPAGLAYALHPDHTNPTLLPLSEQENWLGARSGFPKQFANACQLIFRQIFRVYAHLYWDHFIDPFYHLNLEKHLNSCFSHFILTATALDLLQPSDVEPMQDLINLWAADGTFPPESRAYSFANLERGKYILSLGSTS